RFASDEDQAMRMLARLHNTEQVLDAEFLVPDSVPFAAVQLIGAANEPQRDRVRGLLAAASDRTKVMVHPPWFTSPETGAG
ncbi:MAG: DarT ssDNA thymidine ADP-ribosyltransferase family protein, partial [Rhodoglobus sp.]